MSASGTGSVSGSGAPTRERPGDLRSAELVSRLLAATPPYLYNMPVVPHSYFFSEMLRSFVHAKNNNDAAARAVSQTPNQQPIHRRSRKRLWNQAKISPIPEGSHMKSEWPHKTDPWQTRNTTTADDRHHEEKYLEFDTNKNHQHSYEKPLELTMNKNIISKHGNSRISDQELDVEEKQESSEVDIHMKTRSPKLTESVNHLRDEKFPGLLTPSAPIPPGLTLPPPPPPLWYPPLYPPPYGIDPLNFFIDLRVSGHIYDRKHSNKESVNLSSTPHHDSSQARSAHIHPDIGPQIFENSNSSAFKENVKSNRHVSAFSVPKPRDSNQFPINLCHSVDQKFNMKYYDDIDLKLKDKQREKCQTNPHYVMHNLKRIYEELSNQSDTNGKEGDKIEGEQEMSGDLDGANDSDSSETKKKRCKDLRALIGLELVVDYVKGGRVGNQNGKEGPAADVELSEDQ